MKSYSRSLEEAITLILLGDFTVAQAQLETMLVEIYALPEPLGTVAEVAADIEEHLADLGVRTRQYDDALTHAQRAVLRSQRFRTKANLVAAEAFLGLGNKEMALSKLRMIVDWAETPSVVKAAKERIERIEKAAS